MLTTTPSNDIRGRRNRLDVSRIALAMRSQVSLSWLTALESGLRPVHGSPALGRVEAALDQLEAEATNGPEAA